ncbi:DUF6916 family protein [Rubritalea tangerina]|uniref:DUF6916 family protein n=1 Tax=Rubritalea tangerina TaxID=430798 RepID=A0ABW4ZBK5_9BACT
MDSLLDFKEYEGERFDVYIGEEKVDEVDLVRTGALRQGRSRGYPGVRRDPFELLFRAASDRMMNQSVRLVGKVEFEIFFNPGCYHIDESTGEKVTEYWCLFA